VWHRFSHTPCPLRFKLEGGSKGLEETGPGGEVGRLLSTTPPGARSGFVVAD